MNDDFIPRLRGNTFFLFLLRAARQGMGVAPSWGTSSNGLTQTQLFAALMRVVQPSYTIPNEDTLRQYISQYMKGDRTDSKTYYPFKSSGFRSGTELRIQSDYYGAIADMNDLCQTFLQIDDDASNRLLVGGLVSLILKDGSIPSETPFNTGHKTVTRKELGEETEFVLQPFLLSVWHYIVVHKPDAKEGSETYMRWTKDAGGGNPREITTSWGTNWAKKIAVSTDLPEEILAETAEEDITDDETEPEPVVEETPRVEIYEAPYTDPRTQQQVVAQFHVEAKDNGVAIGQVFGGLVIGKRGKDE